MMDELEVRIVTLAPMRVASLHGFGESPELLAWDKLVAWAEPKGLLDDPEKTRLFGFNNPNPSPGSPNYGYEVWITVGEDVEPESGVEIKDIPGGLYAVTRCPQGAANITPTWERLVAWLAASKYKHAQHQWLEEHIWEPGVPMDEENLVLDLYAPVAE